MATVRVFTPRGFCVRYIIYNDKLVYLGTYPVWDKRKAYASSWAFR